MKVIDMVTWGKRLDQYLTQHFDFIKGTTIQKIQVILLCSLGTNMQETRAEKYITELQKEIQKKYEIFKSKRME